jgi:hypothetical protein
MEWQTLLESGKIAIQVEIARRERITRDGRHQNNSSSGFVGKIKNDH